MELWGIPLFWFERVEFAKGESEAWTWQFLLTQNVQYQPQFIHPPSCLETVLTFDTESFPDSI